MKYLVNALGAVLVVALSFGATAPALSQTQPQPTVGMVDVQKAFTTYKVTKDSEVEVSKLADGFKRDLQVRVANRLLTEAELTELIKINANTAPTEPEKKRADELEKISKERDEQLNLLSQKADASEQEKATLRELRDRANRNEATGRTLAEEYSSNVEKRKAELSDKLTEALKAAIAKVAQQKGLATVVDKVAVLYGGVDLTEDVIKVLNGS